jgi:hypothetical protein
LLYNQYECSAMQNNPSGYILFANISSVWAIKITEFKIPWLRII